MERSGKIISGGNSVAVHIPNTRKVPRGLEKPNQKVPSIGKSPPAEGWPKAGVGDEVPDLGKCLAAKEHRERKSSNHWKIILPLMILPQSDPHRVGEI